MARRLRKLVRKLVITIRHGRDLETWVDLLSFCCESLAELQVLWHFSKTRRRCASHSERCATPVGCAVKPLPQPRMLDIAAHWCPHEIQNGERIIFQNLVKSIPESCTCTAAFPEGAAAPVCYVPAWMDSFDHIRFDLPPIRNCK